MIRNWILILLNPFSLETVQPVQLSQPAGFWVCRSRRVLFSITHNCLSIWPTSFKFHMLFQTWLYLKRKLIFMSTLYLLIQHNLMMFTINYQYMSWNTGDKDSHILSHIDNPFTVFSSASSSSLFDWIDVTFLIASSDLLNLNRNRCPCQQISHPKVAVAWIAFAYVYVKVYGEKMQKSADFGVMWMTSDSTGNADRVVCACSWIFMF